MNRPEGQQVDWMIVNKTNAMAKITLDFTVSGPCNYKKSESSNVDLNPGTGLATNLYTVSFFESDCTGQYTVELQVSSHGQRINSATTTVTVF